ncbi:MAG TPA: hypothetical protein VI522_08075 [Gammaproteobacteria bacterium]|nr:hypothetical protein [Gammaproteobacteria bacterium]
MLYSYDFDQTIVSGQLHNYFMTTLGVTPTVEHSAGLIILKEGNSF